MDVERLERSDLIRVAAATDVLLAIVERIDGEIAEGPILADLHALRDRAASALDSLGER